MNKLQRSVLVSMVCVLMAPVFAGAQGAAGPQPKREFKLTVLDPKFSELIVPGTKLQMMGTDFGFTDPSDSPANALVDFLVVESRPRRRPIGADVNV